jgi:hypothetical protein
MCDEALRRKANLTPILKGIVTSTGDNMNNRKTFIFGKEVVLFTSGAGPYIKYSAHKGWRSSCLRERVESNTEI